MKFVLIYRKELACASSGDKADHKFGECVACSARKQTAPRDYTEINEPLETDISI